MTARHIAGLGLLLVWGLGIAHCAHADTLPPGIGGCPKPLIHHKHKPSALLCQCQADYPQSPLVAAPVDPDPEPITIGVYRYYYQIVENVTDGDYDTPQYAGNYWLVDPPVSGYIYRPTAAKAPEIDPSCGFSMVLLLCGLLAVIRGYRK